MVETMITPEHQESMRLGRLKALAAGKYDAEYRRKSRDQHGKPHGNDKLISAAHRKKKDQHPSARHHRLRDAAGIVHEFDNAEYFVRSNPELFSEADQLERLKPNKKIFTRAGNGLQAVSNGNKRQWKGWTKA